MQLDFMNTLYTVRAKDEKQKQPTKKKENIIELELIL